MISYPSWADTILSIVFGTVVMYTNSADIIKFVSPILTQFILVPYSTEESKPR